MHKHDAIVFAIGLTLSVTAAAKAQDWPSFRGPNASGIADAHPLPVSWDGEKSTNILWKTPIDGLGHSSPVVWGDRVFVTAATSAAGQPATTIPRTMTFNRPTMTPSINGVSTVSTSAPEKYCGRGRPIRGCRE